MSDRIFQVVVSNQVINVTEEQLRALCPNLTLQYAVAAEEHSNNTAETSTEAFAVIALPTIKFAEFKVPAPSSLAPLNGSRSVLIVPELDASPIDHIDHYRGELTEVLINLPDNTLERRIFYKSAATLNVDNIAQQFIEADETLVTQPVNAAYEYTPKPLEVISLKNDAPPFKYLRHNKMRKTINQTEPPKQNKEKVKCSNCGFVTNLQTCTICRRDMPRPRKFSKILTIKDIKRRIQRKTEYLAPDEEKVTTISSDEEEEPQSSGNTVSDFTKQVMMKEPIITTETRSPLDRIEGGGLETGDLLESTEVEKALLQCRTIRIGTFKVVPEDKVTISPHGIKMTINTILGEIVVLKIFKHEMVRVLIHFGASMPVIFYYVTHRAAIRIREFLKMAELDTAHFDPTSEIEEEKRITLLPDKINEELKLFISSTYDAQCLLVELNAKEANDILVRAAPKDIQSMVAKEYQPDTCSQKSSQPVKGPFTIMVYPPTKGGISINTDDYACLADEQFLNDVIIDFYLKWFVLNKLTPKEQDRTFVLSSFFYKRLTNSAAPFNGLHVETANMSPAEIRHARVKQWTKSVDIFSKDFVIIPINESSHWFLGVICYPGLIQAVRASDNTPIANPSRRFKRERLSGIPGLIVKRVNLSQPLDKYKDEADGDEDDLEPCDWEEENGDFSDTDLVDDEMPKPPKQAKIEKIEEPIKQPCILVFDSLVGCSSRAGVINTLREWVQVEFNNKHKNKKREFNKDTMRGTVPRVPQQDNFTDCGLFLLHYAEMLFERPIRDFRMPIKELEHWFDPHVVSRKRYEVQQLLLKIMDEMNVDPNIRRNLPLIKVDPDGKQKMIDSDLEEDEMEDMEVEDEEVEHDVDEEELHEEEEEYHDDEILDDDIGIQPLTQVSMVSSQRTEPISLVSSQRIEPHLSLSQRIEPYVPLSQRSEAQVSLSQRSETQVSFVSSQRSETDSRNFKKNLESRLPGIEIKRKLAPLPPEKEEIIEKNYVKRKNSLQRLPQQERPNNSKILFPFARNKH